MNMMPYKSFSCQIRTKFNFRLFGRDFVILDQCALWYCRVQKEFAFEIASWVVSTKRVVLIFFHERSRANKILRFFCKMKKYINSVYLLLFPLKRNGLMKFIPKSVHKGHSSNEERYPKVRWWKMHIPYKPGH